MSSMARRATLLAPHDQRAHASLIRALVLSSQPVAALRVLGELEDRLRTDLDRTRDGAMERAALVAGFRRFVGEPETRRASLAADA